MLVALAFGLLDGMAMASQGWIDLPVDLVPLGLYGPSVAAIGLTSVLAGRRGHGGLLGPMLRGSA